MTTEDEMTSHPKTKYAGWLYFASAVVSFICLGLIIAIWNGVYEAPYAYDANETPMLSQPDVSHFLESQKLGFNSADSNIFIPTGMIIQSLEFKGPYTIQVGGYVWQKYSNNLPHLDRGVVFPEADATSFTKVYETQQDNTTLIGWNFKTTLREKCDYSKYPLDRQLIRLRLWPVEFEKNVYLTPDVEGYKSLNPAKMPGVDPGVVLENWKMDQSYFSYRLNSYHSNFGIKGYDPEIPEPELYFNVAIKRYILSPLFARGIAPLVILLQLFVIVLVIGSDSKRLEQFGVRPGAVIFTCAAFFFVILVAENALRDEVKWYGIVYLESLHVLSYFVILGVAANSVALVAFPDLPLFRSDNLWVEVAYWPVILGSLLAITILTFGFCV